MDSAEAIPRHSAALEASRTGTAMDTAADMAAVSTDRVVMATATMVVTTIAATTIAATTTVATMAEVITAGAFIAAVGMGDGTAVTGRIVFTIIRIAGALESGLDGRRTVGAIIPTIIIRPIITATRTLLIYTIQTAIQSHHQPIRRGALQQMEPFLPANGDILTNNS